MKSPTLQRRQLELPECSLSYCIGGEGEPVFLLHGFTRTGRSHWNDEETAFLQDYRLIIPDLRGHGHSSTGSDTISHPAVADDIRQLCLSLGYDKAHFIGFSSGGMALYYLAIAHPELICTVSCISSGIRIEQVTVDSITRACSPENPSLPATVTYLDNLHFDGQGEGYGRIILELWQKLASGGGDPDLTREQLAQIEVPLLIVHGDGDQFFPLAQAREAHAAVSGSRLLVLEQEGHFIQRHFSRELMQNELLQWLKAHPCPAG